MNCETLLCLVFIQLSLADVTQKYIKVKNRIYNENAENLCKLIFCFYGNGL